jgi:hypothetical protein
MDLFDTLTCAEMLVKTAFLGTPTLTVPVAHQAKINKLMNECVGPHHYVVQQLVDLGLKTTIVQFTSLGLFHN